MSRFGLSNKIEAAIYMHSMFDDVPAVHDALLKKLRGHVASAVMVCSIYEPVAEYNSHGAAS